jgi:hypothetical protein
MAEFLHKEIDAGPEDVLEVTLDHPANVLLLDPTNYDLYLRRQPYKYHYGGYVTQGSFRIRPAFKGRWHVVVDLGGGPGTVTAALKTSGSLSP